MSVTRTPRHDAIRRREQIAQAERDRLFRNGMIALAAIGALLMFLAMVRS